MNLQVISWLIAHRDVLLKIVAAAKKFHVDGSYLDKWNVIDEIARLLIPLIDDQVKAFSDEPDGDANVYAASIQDLGIDWQMFVEVLLPLIISIIQMLTKKDE